MGASKLDLYEDNVVNFSQYAKCLSHPARIKIINYLAKNGVSTGKDFIQITGLSQPTVSQHLQVLSKHHMLLTTVNGNVNIYSLNPIVITRIEYTFESFFSQLKSPILK